MSGLDKATTAGEALALVLAHGRAQLNSDDAPREAKLLLALAADVPVSALSRLERDQFTDAVIARYQTLLERRRTGEPVSHLRGFRAFWTHEFEVNSTVLDPRPETEILIEVALEDEFASVLDLGTGSGCILLSLLSERRSATGLGVDLSEKALHVAARNAARLGVRDRVSFRRSDWFAEVDGWFDLIVANPPYIDADVYETLSREVRLFEPRLALTPGPDGTAPYRTIARSAGAFLAPSGRLIVEIGYDQGPAVAALFKAAGFSEVRVRCDLDGRDRVVSARNPA